MIRIFFLSQSSPILELFPFDKITLKSYICTVVTVMAKQCWSQTVLESGSWGHSVLQTPALVSSVSALSFAISLILLFISWPKLKEDMVMVSICIHHTLVWRITPKLMLSDFVDSS